MTTTHLAAAKKETLKANAPGAGLPKLPTAVKDAKATREQMFALRHFHLGDPHAGQRLEMAGDEWLPALLDAYRDTTRLRYNYPLLLFPPEPCDDCQTAERLARPLSEWLEETVDAMGPAQDSARILKDNLPWLERHLRHGRGERDAPEDAVPLLAEAGQLLQRHLRLADSDRERLAEDLERLQAAIPEGGQILTYGRYAALHLLLHAIGSRVLPRRQRFLQQVEESIRGLKALLAIEWGKSAQSMEPQAARESAGPSGDLFDPAVLSSVMSHSRGTREMPAQRRERIEKTLAILEAWKPDPVLGRIIYQQRPSGDWLERSPALAAVDDTEPCTRATSEFDREAARLAEVFGAVRIAQLEIAGRYDPTIHDPWFESFNWEAFSHDELLLVPVVVALESADRVADIGLRAFSKLLSSGRPVQILVRVQPHNNPGAGDKPFDSYRTELGYLGLSHRQAVVTQSSPARHQHLLACFLAALDATRTSLHVINVGLRPSGKLLPLNAWLVAGAAIESRAHPFFRINPEAGDSAAARMDFSDNPQPEASWPTNPFSYEDDNGNRVDTELAFTFADYAFLIERLRDHFRLVPPSCDSDALVSMQDYLAMPPEEAYQDVPFIWVVDGSAQLHRLVVSRALTLACRDRHNFWRSLQELAGVRNRYVELAIRQTRTEERALAAQARERLETQHKSELEQVRRTAASKAMQQLADTLLGMDFSRATAPVFLPSSVPEPVTETELAAVVAEGSPEPAVATEGEVAETFEEAWIDTPLCTSCNDCTKLNPRLFLYNDEKQALLGDLKAGTYAEVVQAAELCPAHCIHPGKPWDPTEPGLDELIERAAPFNQV
jgi:ferredoxin